MWGAIAGVGMALLQNHQNRKAQERLMEQQQQNTLALQQWNEGKEMRMWNNTNYKAQIEKMKEAGINPGLVYGMSGGGGTTTGGTGATAGGVPEGGQQNVGMALQNALLQSQMENIEADTEKKKAETVKTAGVDTKVGEATVANLTATTGNTEMDTKLKAVEVEIKGIEAKVAGATVNEAIDIIKTTAEKLEEETNIAGLQARLDKAVINDRIAIIRAELALKIADKALKESQTAVNKGELQMQQAEMQKWIREGIQIGQSLQIAGQNANTESQKQQEEAWRNDMPASLQATGEIVEKAIMGIIFGGMKPAGAGGSIGFPYKGKK